MAEADEPNLTRKPNYFGPASFFFDNVRVYVLHIRGKSSKFCAYVIEGVANGQGEPETRCPSAGPAFRDCRLSDNHFLLAFKSISDI